MSTYNIVLRPFEEDVTVAHSDEGCIHLLAKFDDYDEFPVSWNNGDAVSLIVGNEDGSDVVLRVEGLVSDNSIVLLYGSCGMEILCSSADFERFYNLHISESGSILEMVSDSARLTMRIFLSGNLHVDMSDHTHMTVAKNMRSNESILRIETHQITLTAVVLAVVSVWSDSLMSDLADVTMQDMIYTEVG